MVARRCWPKAIFSRWRSNSRRAVSSKERAAEARDATPPSPPTGPFPPFVRPSIRLAPRGVILGHCRRSHCEIPHLSSATVASLDSSRASKRSEERGGRTPGNRTRPGGRKLAHFERRRVRGIISTRNNYAVNDGGGSKRGRKVWGIQPGFL